jgi:hypothetical protein
MNDPGVQDLFGLDREVARAAKALEGWRARLATDPADAADDDPFDGLRRVAAKTTWDRLGELQPSLADEPLRAAIRRWVLAFVQARIGGVDDFAWAREAAAPRAHYEGPEPRSVSWPEAWRGVVLSRSAAEVPTWLSAVADAAPSLAPLQRRRAARRVEVARRMGLAHPWEQLVPVSPTALRASAARLLERTDDLSRSIWEESLEEEPRAAAMMHAAVAREAGDGWPARLTPRWLEETFGACTLGLELSLPALPQAVGAASFARALSLFGFAVRLACSDRAMPFTLAREPAFAAAHRFAFVAGALASDPEFQVRALGIGRRSAGAQARVLARTSLFEARLTAARVLLGDDLGPARDVFDDVTARLFGAPLDSRLHGAWPLARADEPGRWLGLLRAPELRRALRDEFDIDWFRNPRAWTHLRATGAMPAHEAIEEASLEVSGDELVRFFEDALG